MKHVYFARHGSTDSNEAGVYQVESAPLSEKGREQAEFLANRFTKIPFDVLVSSDMERAFETARIIGSKTDHSVITEPLFREIKRPTAVYGKSRIDPEVVKIMDETFKNFYKGGEGYHSDEENFHDAHARARKALSHLIERQEEHLVVVTHGVILDMIVGVMFAGDAFTPEVFKQIYDFTLSSNTGITYCQYRPESATNKWRLITWNDFAHLG